MTAAPNEQWLSPKEIAARYRVSAQAVRLWVKSGALPAIRAGGQYRIKEADLLAYLQRDQR